MTDQKNQVALTPVTHTGTLARAEQIATERMELIKKTFMPGCSTEELRLFVETAQHSHLDPFAVPKQIHAARVQVTIQRPDGSTGSEMAWRPIVSIDGLRLIASRYPEYQGQTKTEWCAADGRWLDIWLQDEPPAAARVGVWREGHREPDYGIATWKQFARTFRDKNTREKRLMPQWEAMPAHLLAKVAESIALRKAFPNDLQRFHQVAIEGEAFEVEPGDSVFRPEIHIERPPSAERLARNYEDITGEAPPPRLRTTFDTTNVLVTPGNLQSPPDEPGDAEHEVAETERLRKMIDRAEVLGVPAPIGLYHDVLNRQNQTEMELALVELRGMCAEKERAIDLVKTEPPPEAPVAAEYEVMDVDEDDPRWQDYAVEVDRAQSMNLAYTMLDAHATPAEIVTATEQLRKTNDRAKLYRRDNPTPVRKQKET